MQKNIFLSGEADAWLQRNTALPYHNILDWKARDPLASLISQLPLSHTSNTLAVEVGCGQGLRIQALRDFLNFQVSGLDPSLQAVNRLLSLDLNAYRGTADILPYDNDSIDLLIYGFCLYLCDRQDLPQIIDEAHRILKRESWIVILDFWSPVPCSNPYRHTSGVESFKDDLPAIFTAHPDFTTYDHMVRHHSTFAYTDDSDEFVSISCLRCRKS